MTPKEIEDLYMSDNVVQQDYTIYCIEHNMEQDDSDSVESYIQYSEEDFNEWKKANNLDD